MFIGYFTSNKHKNMARQRGNDKSGKSNMDEDTGKDTDNEKTEYAGKDNHARQEPFFY